MTSRVNFCLDLSVRGSRNIPGLTRRRADVVLISLWPSSHFDVSRVSCPATTVKDIDRLTLGAALPERDLRGPLFQQLCIGSVVVGLGPLAAESKEELIHPRSGWALRPVVRQAATQFATYPSSMTMRDDWATPPAPSGDLTDCLQEKKKNYAMVDRAELESFSAAGPAGWSKLSFEKSFCSKRLADNLGTDVGL